MICPPCQEAADTVAVILARKPRPAGPPMTTPDQKPPRLKNALANILFLLGCAVVVWVFFHALFGAA